MLGSNWTPLDVQFCGSAIVIGASGIGNSPPTVSAWSLERYGQNVTAFESETPAGQFASPTEEPFTGFSGTGGWYVVAEGEATSCQTAGPGVGSVTVPVRRPHQLFVAETGVAVLFDVPSAVVLRTLNALSVMLLAAIVEACASTRRTPAPSRRFALFSAWL